MKKVLLILALAVLAMCLFIVTASADTIYKDENGTELFRYQLYDGTEEGYNKNYAGTIKSYQGEFPLVDENGNALTWYVVSTATEGDDTVKTVACFKTIDDGTHASLSDSGVYKYVNVNKELSLVSVYYPDNSNILKLNLTDNGYGVSYSFKYESELLFVYLPNTLTEMPSRLGQGTPILDCTISPDAPIPSFGATTFHHSCNLRSVDIPKNLTIIYSNEHSNNGCTFFSCYNLVDVDFAEGSKIETIKTHAFYNCTSLKEITLPNSLINLEYRTFENCSKLETVRMGAKVGVGVSQYNVQSLFYQCISLKYVYITDTMVPAKGSHMFNDGASGMVFFYTGSYAQYETFLANLKTLGNNGKFTNATPIEWDSTKDDQYYKDLAASDKKNYVVYGYGKCEAFYGGHAWKGETNVIAGNYFETIGIGDTCANCGGSEVKETIAPIFTWKGYSACTFGEGYSVVQGFYVNKAAIDAYMEYAPDFDYGILATVNAGGEAIAPKLGDDNVLTSNFDKGANDYLDIKVTGIPKGYEGTKVVFCVYVTVGEKMYYLDNNTTGETITGISYSEVVALNNN